MPLLRSKKQRLIPVHPVQAAFLDCKATFKAFKAGIGSGKSFIGAYDLLRRVERGRLYLIAAPTYDMLRDASLRSFFRVAEILERPVKLHKQERTLTLANGAQILFRSADDPEHLRGPNLSGVWLDEASLMIPDAFSIAIGRLREKNRLGWLTATFTPKGRGHWTYEVFGTGKPNTALFEAKTKDNPFNPPEFYTALSGQYSGSFARQELEGDWDADDDIWQLIPTHWVQMAQARWTEEKPDEPLSCIGVDVAHGGADKTVIAPRYGIWFAPLKKYQGKDTDSGEKAAHLVMREIPSGSDAPVNVDAIGYGSGCHEELRKQIGKRAIAVNVANAPDPPLMDRSKKYKLARVRSAMHWRLREALDPINGENLALPPDRELLADLTAARFEVRASGIFIEEKEDIRKRLGRSPDCADAVALAHWNAKGWKLTPEIFKFV